MAKDTKAVENPAPAKEAEASGAVQEPSIAKATDMDHPSVDSNPRAGTTADQNRQDWNDPKRRKPSDRDYAGMGLDPTPYGKASKK